MAYQIDYSTEYTQMHDATCSQKCTSTLDETIPYIIHTQSKTTSDQNIHRYFVFKCNVHKINGYKCAQIFCNEDYIMVVPMKLKSQAGQALVQFIQEVGVPTNMVADGAAETTGENTEFVQNIRKYHIYLKYTEPYTPRQNFAERMIGEI
jgi:hypothetical protein